MREELRQRVTLALQKHADKYLAKHCPGATAEVFVSVRVPGEVDSIALTFTTTKLRCVACGSTFAIPATEDTSPCCAAPFIAYQPFGGDLP